MEQFKEYLQDKGYSSERIEIMLSLYVICTDKYDQPINETLQV